MTDGEKEQAACGMTAARRELRKHNKLAKTAREHSSSKRGVHHRVVALRNV